MSNADMPQTEKEKQEAYPWRRSVDFNEYSSILGWYQAQSCLEHAHGPCVLDMPCGDGMLTALFAQVFPDVVGVDASSAHLAEARKRVPSATFVESLIEEFETDKRFDSIFMLNVLEHVVDPVVTLQKAASLMKPEGTLIVHVPNARAINRRLAVIMGTLQSCEELSPFDIDVVGHRRSYDLDSLQADVRTAGLAVRATGGIFYKMISLAQMDWFLRNGLWEEGGFGWGRVGGPKKDWKAEFCRACYEIGRERPEDCNVIYAVASKL